MIAPMSYIAPPIDPAVIVNHRAQLRADWGSLTRDETLALLAAAIQIPHIAAITVYHPIRRKIIHLSKAEGAVKLDLPRHLHEPVHCDILLLSGVTQRRIGPLPKLIQATLRAANLRYQVVKL